MHIIAAQPVEVNQKTSELFYIPKSRAKHGTSKSCHKEHLLENSHRDIPNSSTCITGSKHQASETTIKSPFFQNGIPYTSLGELNTSCLIA
ncbi:hypothetical protein NPIL_500981 [Nephila pilipes]|uniref:Uncharacterized protein n=1 Tax=Nephila pilipes TaxID=299642 RepID=A0A8X6TS95_NEPPI|nr:hypothetical protein NPIL_500981 [Nephila pilipes]